MPHSPARGQVAFIVYSIVISMATISFYVLLFFAIYRGFSVVWLAEELQRCSGWPANTLESMLPGAGKEMIAEQNQDPAPLDHWLNARFIASVTEPVQRIIFYPFPVLALFILARTQFFADRFYIPSSLLVLFLIFFILVVIVASRLRSTSEKIRGDTLETLDDHILAAKMKGSHDLAVRLEAMRDQVLELKTGAFAPFTQQPLVRAVLTVVGSYSGLKLLEYANLANF